MGSCRDPDHLQAILWAAAMYLPRHKHTLKVTMAKDRDWEFHWPDVIDVVRQMLQDTLEVQPSATGRVEVVVGEVRL